MIEMSLAEANCEERERPLGVEERRRESRRPYSEPLFLTPVDENGAPLTDRSFSVIGRNVSSSGVDFYTYQPVTDRYVIASFPIPEGEWLAFVLHLTWCRFNRHGWYDNGGKFARLVAPPLPPRERD
ncbi:MAG: hypothetical protein R3B96_23050 [Pirellulaceae bacterium]